MKKFLALLLAMIMVFTLVSCNKPDNGDSSQTTTSSPNSEDYAFILRLSINPEIDITVGKDGKVISAKGTNEDGRALLPDVTYINVAYADAAKIMVEAAIEKGYLKAGGEVRISVPETKDKSVDKAAILDAAADAVEAVAESRNMSITVVRGVSTENSTTSKPSENTSSNPTNNDTETDPDTPAVDKDEDEDENDTSVSDVLNPKTSLPYDKEYAGNFSVHGNELWGFGFSFHTEGGIDGPFILMLGFVFEDAQTDPDQTYITYNGTKYYSMGAGQTPYNMELTDTEIIVKNSFYDSEPTVSMKLTLKSNNTFVVTYSALADYPVGTVLSFLR